MSNNSVYLAGIGEKIRIRLEEITGRKIKGEYFAYKVMRNILNSEDLFKKLAEEIKAKQKVEITDNYSIRVVPTDLWNFTPSDEYCNNFIIDFESTLDALRLAEDKKFEENSCIITDDDMKIITSLSTVQVAQHVRFIVNSWYYFFKNVDLGPRDAMNNTMLTFIKCHFHENFEDISEETLIYINRVLNLNQKTRLYDFTRIKQEYKDTVSWIGIKF